MNKQLINKHKPEFDHWLNGGSLLARVITSDEDDFMYTIWYIVDNNDLDVWKATYLFSLTDKQIEYYKPQFVINDEYVEFRKALAEGKVIEYLGQSSNVWHEVQEPDFNLHPTCYRIKPDEPKFKVGDFVTHESLKITRQITKVDDDFIYFKEGSWALPHVEGFSNKLILWTPIKGEWCWFYDNPNTDKYCNLSQFGGESNGRCFISITDMHWQFCEPFLNSIPSYLKDK